MSTNYKRKQDEKHLKILRELASQPSNKICFDCHQRGPTYINMTIGSFVCTTCSGHLRGLNPPHRVKSISMASFTAEEIEVIRTRGNSYCKQVWLGLFDEKSKFDLQSKDEQKIKEFMIAKYEKKRFYLDSVEASKLWTKQESQPESNKSAFKIPAPSSAISRTVVGLNSLPKSNGLSKPVTKSSSVDLLSGIMSASEHLEKKNSLTNSFAFPPPSSSPSVPCISKTRNENFANFDNANIFSNAPEDVKFADLSEGFPCLEPSQTSPCPKTVCKRPDLVSSHSCDEDQWESTCGGDLLIPSGDFPVALPSLNLAPDVPRSAAKTAAIAIPKSASIDDFRSSSLPSCLDSGRGDSIEPVPFFGFLKSSTKGLIRSVSKERKPRQHRSSSLSVMSGSMKALASYEKEGPDSSSGSLSNIVKTLQNLSDFELRDRRESVDSVGGKEPKKHLSAISTRLRARILSEESWQAPPPPDTDTTPITPVVLSKPGDSVQPSDFDDLFINTELGSPRSASFDSNPTTNTEDQVVGQSMTECVANQLTNASDFLAEPATVKSSPIPFPYSSNPLTPLSTSAGSPSSPPNIPAPSTSADKYAALKDLDEAFKFHKEKTTVKEPPAPDANFNHHANGSTQNKAYGNGSNWANFDAQKESSPFGNTNPWVTTTSNPFASTQQPTSGNSYNPFL